MAHEQLGFQLAHRVNDDADNDDQAGAADNQHAPLQARDLQHQGHHGHDARQNGDEAQKQRADERDAPHHGHDVVLGALALSLIHI